MKGRVRASERPPLSSVGPLLGEAESRGAQVPALAGAARLRPTRPPPPAPGAQMGDLSCGSWERPGPTLLTLRPLSSEPGLATSCPGDVSSGQREGSPRVGECFPEAPRTWQEKGLALCPGSRGFHITVKAANRTSPQTLQILVSHYFRLRKNKKANTHRAAIHYSSKTTLRARWEELLKIISLNSPPPQN